MRENESFFSKLFFSYAKPLLDSSMTQRIRFEQYGELPDRLKIKDYADDIEKEINQHLSKNPDDKYALLRGVYTKVKTRFYLFSALRVFFAVTHTLRIFLMKKLIDWVTNETPDDNDSYS